MPAYNSTYDSILTSVKKICGIDGSDTAFDPDLILYINTLFLYLYQMGIGPTTPYSITGSTEVWTAFIGNAVDLEPVKTYISLKTKMTFDPPASSTVCEQINNAIKEAEWRLMQQVETYRRLT